MRGDGDGAQRGIVGEVDADGRRLAELTLALIEQELDVMNLGIWEVGGREQRGLHLRGAVQIEQTLHAHKGWAERPTARGEAMEEVLGSRCSEGEAA